MEKLNIDNLFSSKNKTLESSDPLTIYTLFHPEVNKEKNNFSVDKLINVREKRKNKIVKEYKKKYIQCCKNIEELNNLNTYCTTVVVPIAVYDCPDYKPEDCIKYIENKLKKYYMDILVLSNKSIFISWDNIKENRDKANEEKNRIKQLENEERDRKININPMFKK